MNVPGSNGTVISVGLRTIHCVSRCTWMNNSRNYPGKATNPIQTTRSSIERLSVNFRYPEGLFERRSFFLLCRDKCNFTFSILLIRIHAVNIVLFFSFVWQTSQLSGILQAQELYWWFYILCNCYSEMKV